MKTLLASLALALCLSAPAFGATSWNNGNTTWHNLDDGRTGSTTHMGNQSLHNFSDGTTGSSYKMGDTTFHNFSGPNGDVSGSSQRIGDTTYHNFDNGQSGSSTDVGGMTITNGF